MKQIIAVNKKTLGAEASRGSEGEAARFKLATFVCVRYALMRTWSKSILRPVWG
jgi:hypothetical protein